MVRSLSVPERYHLPAGPSISNEIGGQRPNISPDSWTWELRPGSITGFDPLRD
jgi:hypothetical protein